jgi:hypothetical protein
MDPFNLKIKLNEMHNMETFGNMYILWDICSCLIKIYI